MHFGSGFHKILFAKACKIKATGILYCEIEKRKENIFTFCFQMIVVEKKTF